MDSYKLDTTEITKDKIASFILDQDHPCVMAQTVFKSDAVIHYNFDSIFNNVNDLKILSYLDEYISNYDFSSKNFQTFIITFQNDYFTTEIAFEEALWNFLFRLNQRDDNAWDPSVSSDINNPKFSFSLLDKAFYIIGMHPESSRNARSTECVTIVFNLHHQFEILRDMNVYQTVRNRIRKRDKEKNGSINPMLEDFGRSSEALQYSGRNTTEISKCPFLNK